MNFSYPGDPVFVYDHLTGDISDWWDHSFVENPLKLFIEARRRIFSGSNSNPILRIIIPSTRTDLLHPKGDALFHKPAFGIAPPD
jgi:hypothetical protein